MREKLRNLFLICLAVGLICLPLGTAARIALSRNEVSFYENRRLAAKPELTGEALWDGSYATGLDSYLSEHMIGRDGFIMADTKLDLLLRPVSHGIVVTETCLLPFHGYETWGTSYLAGVADEVGTELAGIRDVIAENGGAFFYLGVPQQYSYYREQYPDYMDDRSWTLDVITAEFARAMEEQDIPFVQAMEVYRAQGSPAEYYSGSDHHYTYRGMLAAYGALMEEITAQTGLELKIYREEDLILETLPNEFLGSRNRAIFGQWPTEEKVEIARLREPIPFTREDNDIPVPAEVYALPAAGERVTYSVYMGEDVAETVIRTDRPELPKLLIYGDSYTNAMETLLWASFDETRSLDYRYYTGKSLTEYIAEYRPDVVICIRDDTSYLSREGNGGVS